MFNKHNKASSLVVLGAIFVSSFLVFNFANAAGGITIDNFDLNPKVIADPSQATFQMTFRGRVNVTEFNTTCGSNANEFLWRIVKDQNDGISDPIKMRGRYPINRTQTTLTFNLDEVIRMSISSLEARIGVIRFRAEIYCSGTWFVGRLSSSAPVSITFGSGSKIRACVAANNKYACSPANLTNCSDVSACAGRPCVEINSSLCGQDAGSASLPPPGGGAVCGNNRCESGETQTSCPSDCKPGEDQSFDFIIDNPLKGGADDFSELVRILAQWIFNLAIPIAVAMIVYSGILFLTAAGEPAKVTKAKDVLKYAVIGLAIILIGSGFVTLIQSILDLGAPADTSGQPMLPVSEGVACRGGADCPQGFSCDLTSGTCFASSRGSFGSSCSADRDCLSGLVCNSICQRPSGNLQGEPCAGGRNCAEGLGCDASGDNVQVIGGQNRGTCR